MEPRILYKDIFILRADQSRTQKTNVYKVYFWVLVGIVPLPVATTQLKIMSVIMCVTTTADTLHRQYPTADTLRQHTTADTLRQQTTADTLHRQYTTADTIRHYTTADAYVSTLLLIRYTVSTLLLTHYVSTLLLICYTVSTLLLTQ